MWVLRYYKIQVNGGSVDINGRMINESPTFYHASGWYGTREDCYELKTQLEKLYDGYNGIYYFVEHVKSASQELDSLIALGLIQDPLKPLKIAE